MKFNLLIKFVSVKEVFNGVVIAFPPNERFSLKVRSSQLTGKEDMKN